jgi:hypothetical protein
MGLNRGAWAADLPASNDSVSRPLATPATMAYACIWARSASLNVPDASQDSVTWRARRGRIVTIAQWRQVADSPPGRHSRASRMGLPVPEWLERIEGDVTRSGDHGQEPEPDLGDRT